jgi:cobalt-zinc-cadmium resistance protein CzcA
VESVVTEVSDLIDNQVNFQPGYTVSYGGQFENLVEAKQRLAIAVPLALLLIFILLYFTFGSLKQGVLIFTAIPLSAIGGVFALWIRDMPFSISAGVGFIALFGVAVLNGIVLIAEFNRLKEDGITDIFQRVYIGTKTRLRPVILTAAVASLGFLPMAISQTSGAEVQRPLATVVIGGLITATFLTLVVLPILYYYSEKKVTMKLNKITTLLIIFLMGSVYQATAQTETTVYQSIDEVLEIALKNNPTMKVSALKTEKAEALKGTSFNLPKTDLGLDYGQTNSIADSDTRFSISQTFEFPTVYTNQSKLATSRVTASQLRQQVVENDLVAQVNSTYYTLWFLKNKEKVLQRQDSIYSRFSYAAQLRFDNGESNALELGTANAELADIQIMVQENQAAIEEIRFALKYLLNADTAVDINVAALELKTAVKISDSNDIDVSNNPLVSFYNQQIEVAENERKVASAQLLPDITLGYFNQSFIGTGQFTNDTQTPFDSSDRFMGVQLGLSIPLWSKPHTAKIMAAKIQKQENEAQLEAVQNETKSQLQSLFAVLQKNLNNIKTYKESGLPQSDLLLRTAQRGFEEGEIGYIEYVQGINRALTIQVKYLEYLNQYNQTLINIEQLTKDI